MTDPIERRDNNNDIFEVEYEVKKEAAEEEFGYTNTPSTGFENTKQYKKFKQAVDNLSEKDKLKFTNLLYELQYNESSKATKSIVCKHFTEIAKNLKNDTPQDFKNRLDKLDKELAAKPMNSMLRIAIGMVVGAIIMTSIAVTFAVGFAAAGAIITGWSGGWGALPAAILGAIKGYAVGLSTVSALGIFAVASTTGAATGALVAINKNNKASHNYTSRSLECGKTKSEVMREVDILRTPSI